MAAATYGSNETTQQINTEKSMNPPSFLVFNCRCTSRMKQDLISYVRIFAFH